MEAIFKDPERISQAFRKVREDLKCSSCFTPGKLTFSSDGNGRLRFCCSNKLKACRKSYSMKNMVLLIEQHSPGTFDDNHTTINNGSDSDIVKNNLTNQVTPLTSIIGQKRPLSNPSTSPEAARTFQFKEFGNNNISNNQVIQTQQALMDQQATEITNLREEVKNLTSQVSSLTELIKQSILNTSSKGNQQNPNEFHSSQENNNVVQVTPIQSANNQINKNINTTASSSPIKKTYAQIASSRRLTGDDHQAAVKALELLCKRPRIKPTASNLHKVYVQGIARQPIKQLKTLFQSVRIRTSALVSISFVGLQTAEFLVTGDYVNGFKKAITDLSPVDGRFKILETYDAAKASDPQASTQTKINLEAAFVRRLHGIIASNPNQAAKDYFNQWLAKLNLPLPADPEEVHVEDEHEEHDNFEHEASEIDIEEENIDNTSGIATPEMSTDSIPELAPTAQQ